MSNQNEITIPIGSYIFTGKEGGVEIAMEVTRTHLRIADELSAVIGLWDKDRGLIAFTETKPTWGLTSST